MSSPKTHCPLCDEPWDVCACQNNPAYNAEAANDLLKALYAVSDVDEECGKCYDCSKKKGKPCIED